MTKVADYEARVQEGGGPARRRRQKMLRRLSIWERLEALVDDGTWVELGRYRCHQGGTDNPNLAANRHPGDGVVTGTARIAGVLTCVYGHDTTVLRGALGAAGCDKLRRLLALAEERRLPVIGLADSQGARVQEGIAMVGPNAGVLEDLSRLRTRVPVITLVSGLCGGAAAYGAVLGHVLAMIDGQSYMFVTGPTVTRLATGQDVDIDELGGPRLHAESTGACHEVLADETEALAWVRRVVSYLGPPAGGVDDAQRACELRGLVPESLRMGYDMRKVVRELFDRDSVTELGAAYARNLLTVLARLDGVPVAVLASQPQHLAGALDAAASRKGAHHIRLAHTWGLPIITLVDVPGYLPGVAAERGGILPIGAELINAYTERMTPHLCLVLRKCYGGGSVLAVSSEYRLGLPMARIGPMGARAARSVDRVEAGSEKSPGPEGAGEGGIAAPDDVYVAAEGGFIDRIVEPEDARRALCQVLSRSLELRGSRS